MKNKKTIMLLTLALSLGSISTAYQPKDAYELDQWEIKDYLKGLKKKPKNNEKEIQKFERILKEDIYDWKEYDNKYGATIETFFTSPEFEKYTSADLTYILDTLYRADLLDIAPETLLELLQFTEEVGNLPSQQEATK